MALGTALGTARDHTGPHGTTRDHTGPHGTPRDPRDHRDARDYRDAGDGTLVITWKMLVGGKTGRREYGKTSKQDR